jgi:hypothetical protein
VPIALSRTLSTQGVVLRLPPQLTIGDSLAVPSLCAAILLGLREVIGGDPDHLNIVSTVDPVMSDGSDNISSLLIHDSVPGGTGYLAELADPDQIRDLFLRAWVIVRDCVCATEGRAACHRCLLPFAPGGNVEMVSRVSAEHTLRRLLDVSEEGEPRPWTIMADAPPPTDTSAVFEHYFRDVFIQRAKALGASVKEIPGDWGNTIQVTIPGSRRLWMLRPQVPLGHTTPDFVLEQHGGGVQPIAIYTDGLAFHASVLHNRIADDATKRRGARDMGYHVMAITWADVERAAADTPEPTPTWFNRQIAANFTSQFGISLSSLDHVTANPLTQLMEWMQDPTGASTRWSAIADALPVLTLQPSSTFVDLGDDSLVQASARALMEAPLPASTEAVSWQLRHGRLVNSSQLTGNDGTTQTVLLLDDREAALQSQGFADDWRMWLKLSNLLMDRATILALSEVDSIHPDSSESTVPELADADWQPVLDQALEVERPVLFALAASGVPIPQIGAEIGDGIPVSFAWPAHRVAASAGLAPAEVDELQGAGWTVADFTSESIIAALDGK